MKFTSGSHLANDHEIAINKSKEDEIAYLFLYWRRNIFTIFKAIDIIKNKANQINYKRVLIFNSETMKLNGKIRKLF